MTHEEKKAAKIAEELTMYFFALEASYIDTRIEKQPEQTVITLKADFNPVYADKLSRLDQYLNGQKNDSMEDIYWELAGSSDPGEPSQLLLIGAMIEHAEITIRSDCVTIKLYRKRQN